MSRVLCLAQAHGPAKQPRSKTSAAKTSSAKTSRAAKDAAKPQAFTILERVPLRLAAHKPIWDALRKHAMRQLIVDDEHHEDAIPAGVVLIDQLGAGVLNELSDVLGERRALVLAAEKQGIDCDLLAKPLDRIYEQELEWLQIRNILAVASRTSAKGTRSRKAKALLLMEA
jgi:hypothetical protein